MAKSFNYNDPNAPKDNSYRANSDGVNKELGPKITLPPRLTSSGKKGEPLARIPLPQSKKGAPLAKAPLPQGKKGKPLARAPLPQGKKGAPLPKVPLPQGKKGEPLAKNPLTQGKKGLPLAKVPFTQGKRGEPLATTNTGSYDKWPLSKFAFVVNIGGFDGEIAFQGMDGLGASVGKMEFRDGNSSKFYKQTRPTLTSYEPVTLKKGMFSGDTVLFDWFTNVSQGAMFSDMRTVSIQLCELKGSGLEHIFTWTLEKAYITKFTPSSLDGEADTELAIEEIELTYQSFSMNAGAGGGIGGLIGGLLGTVSGAISGSFSGSISI